MSRSSRLCHHRGSPWLFMTLLVLTTSIAWLCLFRPRQESASWWNNDEESPPSSWHRYMMNDTVDENEHLPLFPLQASDLWALTCATVGLLLAAGGGIGGGGILVPIYILILGFPAKHAIPLSNVTVFGGAVANTLLNVRKRHPLADRPLIDWDLILVMEPLTIAGALFGANLNKMLPEIVIVTMLVILLSFTAHKTFRKARTMHTTESLGWSMVETEEDDHDSLKLSNMEDAVTSRRRPRKLRRRSSPDCFPSDESRRPQGSYVVRTKSLPATLDGSFLDELKIDDDMYTRGQLTVKESSSIFRSVDDSPTCVAVLDHQRSEAGNFLASMMDLKVTKDELELPSLDEKISRGLSNGGYEKVRSTMSALEIDYGDSNVDESSTDVPLAEILEQERHTPRRNVLAVVTLFMVVLFINIVKGGGAFPSPIGIECGSLSFWAAQTTILACILCVSVSARSYLIDRACMKERANYQYVEGDIVWNSRSTLIYPAICCVAGFCAGLFGIGGGIVKGPLMLTMGVHPSVASATSACMILFTSFTATTSFVVFGLLVTDYAVVCLIVGFLATLVGQTAMAFLLRKHGRHSYIAFSIGTVVAISAVCMTLESAMRIAEGGSQRYSGLCGSHLG